MSSPVPSELLESQHQLMPGLEANRGFLLLVHTVTDYAIFLMDRVGTIASWNEGAERILGYQREEILGRPGSTFFLPEDLAAGLFDRELRTATETGRASDENWLVRKNGSRFWASGVSTALRGPGGETLGFAKILRDLTERKAEEDALREKELRLRVALSAARMGTWHWDILANKQTLDESLSRLVGLPPGRFVGSLEGFLQVVHPDDRTLVADTFGHSVRDGVNFDIEFRVVWPDASVHWLKDQGDVVHGPEGQPLYLTGACVDITDRKQMEEELRQRAGELAEADRRKDEFLAMLAHELRNPLAPLRNGLRVLQMAAGDAGAFERARSMMERQLSHLVRLVDDLLDVARINRNKLDLQRTRITLADAVAHAVESARPALDAAGHELHVELPPEPVPLDADLTRLAQVFGNLLTNSARYTEPGGRIWLTAVRDGHEVVVAVRDTGIGIPAEALPHLFDLFCQGDRRLERAQGGLGIGLALVKALTEMHGGTVEAHSPGPGRGSTFVVHLPVAVPAEPADAAAPSALRGGSRRRILIADDNRDIADSLALYLALCGHEVRTAWDGLEAVALAAAFRPDAIVLDIGMPGLNGYDACRRIRAEPWASGTLIVAATGWGQEADRQKSREAGFDHHLVKPVDPDVLERILTTGERASQP